MREAVLQQGRGGSEFRPLRFDQGLVETEEGAKHPGLSAKVGSGNPEHLSFANHLHRLDSRNHRPRRRHRSWPLHGAQSTLHVSVIGFDAIIRITASSLTARTMQLALALQLPNRGGVASKFVLGEHVWRAVIRVRQSPFEEAFGGRTVPSLR